MKLRSVEVGALLRSRLTSKERGRRFLELLIHRAPALSPDLVGFFEPVRTAFDATDVSTILANWGQGFLWRRRQPRLSGHIVHAPKGTHDVVYLSCTPAAFVADAVHSLLTVLEQNFGLELAYIHGRSAEDTLKRDAYMRNIMPFSQGLTTHDLREGIPGFPWMLLFGPSYVELLGKDHLLNMPAARIEALGDTIAGWLTDTISDVANSREVFERASATAVRYLDKNVFRASGARPNVPEFVFDQ